MKTVELSPGIRSSALGFGCAPVLGSVGAKRSRRAIDCAVDLGINHFDLARSYGYGLAEKFVGVALKNKRDKVVLASKFGMRARWPAKILRPLKPLVRLAKSKFQSSSFFGGNGHAERDRTVADRFLYRVPVTVHEMRKSLEDSLSALNTDYLDYFFVHEPLESISHLEDLMAAYEMFKKEGKIRGSGLAYFRKQSHLHCTYTHLFDVLQFDSSPASSGYEDIVNLRSAGPNVIFSPFNNGCRDDKPKKILEHLHVDFPDSVILCSMFSEKHIKENAEVFSR